MATIQGKSGAYSPVTGFNIKADTWTADFNIETVRTTGFDDDGVHTNEPVAVELTGTAAGTGLFDATTTIPIPSTLDGADPTLTAAGGAMTLTATTGCTLAFTGVMRKVGFSRPVADKLSLTHEFVSNGAVTVTWDEGA